MKKINKTAIAILGSLASQGLLAQESDHFFLEEIEVTAQRKSQNIQDVPISMSVVSSEDLSRNSIFDFKDTAQLTPGVTLNGTSAALASIAIRGVGPSFFAPTAQSVPIFVDEVPASQPGAVFSTMVDVERVELLRGPQGTLYGTNAPGGAYNITTVSPHFEGVEGFVNGSLSQWDSNGEPVHDLRGAVNLPISDTLAARVAGVYAQSDGGNDMVNPEANHSTSGGKDHQSLRVKVLWEPSDDHRVNFTTNHHDLDDNYAARGFDGLVPGTGGGIAGGNSIAEPIYTHFGDRLDFSGKRSESTTKVKDYAIKYDWSGDLTNITAIASYQDFETSLYQNQKSHPFATEQSSELNVATKQSTFELRASNSHELLDYVAGIFISDSKTADSNLLSVGFPIETESQTDIFGTALFGNFTFHLAEQWDLGLGLRAEESTQDVKSTAGLFGAISADVDEELKFDHVSWSVKVNYFLNDDTTVYLAIDNAYRQGGSNSFAPTLAVLQPTIAPAFQFYDEEVSTAFELGVKGNAFENRMRYSVAIFNQDYDDHIVRQNEGTGTALAPFGALYSLTFTNAEAVTTQGIEFDFVYLLSENWTVDFRTAYFNATADEWSTRFCTYGDVSATNTYCPGASGTPLSAEPKYNTNTQLSYFQTLDSGWDFYSTLAWTWKSNAAVKSTVTDQFNDGQNIFNLSAGISDGTFSVSLWGKNLTNEDGASAPFNVANGAAGQPAALTIRPNSGREYGVTLGYKF